MQFQKQTTFSCSEKNKRTKTKQEQRTQCPTPVFDEHLRERLRPMNKNK